MLGAPLRKTGASCPVSIALGSINITMEATLVKSFKAKAEE